MITQDYFLYLNQVLGVQNILIPPTIQSINADCLFVTDQTGLSESEGQLFEKMAAAMKLNSKTYELISFSTQQLNDAIEKIQNAKVVLCFEQKAFQYLQIQFPHQNIFLLPHPSQLIQEPSLKKTAWEQMKKAQAYLVQN